MSKFVIHDDDFLLDGKPFQVLSGALHYFRVPREYWSDRIRKAKLMGLNTIETYVAWNLHAPNRNQWITTGNLDLGAFLDEIAAQGMKAIVRPGPFICAEFNGGGLPAWLLNSGTIPVRGSDPRYLEPTIEYLNQVYQIVVPRQIDQEGSVILVQIENEYGAYGRDHQYLQTLTEATQQAGITVPLTTVDQPRPDMLPHGTLPELLATASFGSRSLERLKYLREIQPTGPLMCSEYWDGWFDQWEEYHHVTSVQDSAEDLDQLLSTGASVNIYMFHGGTNFGFTNGANDKGLYRAITTSYDYDAPLDEAGQPTEKYWAYRKVLEKYSAEPFPEATLPESLISPRPVGKLLGRRTLMTTIPTQGWATAEVPPTFDEMGNYQGFGIYRTTVVPASHQQLLQMAEIRDRATVLADGIVVGVMERMDRKNSVVIPAGTSQLTLLVEDMGRVNYGPRIGEAKGVIGPVRLDGVELQGWQTRPLDFDATLMNQLAETDLENASIDDSIVEPEFIYFEFDLEQPTDLFFDSAKWGKGLVWINGHLLGRYWNRGPQETLYIPAPWLVAGKNQLIIFEVEAIRLPELEFSDRLKLGPIDW